MNQLDPKQLAELVLKISWFKCIDLHGHKLAINEPVHNWIPNNYLNWLSNISLFKHIDLHGHKLMAYFKSCENDCKIQCIGGLVLTSL